MRDQLPGLLSRCAQAQPVDHVVQAKLEVAQQVETRDARLALGEVEVVPELLLEQAVQAPRLLLRAELQAIVRRLALACLAVHARREGAPLDGALGRVASLALEVQLGALSAAEPADGAAVVSHLHASPLGR